MASGFLLIFFSVLFLITPVKEEHLRGPGSLHILSAEGNELRVFRDPAYGSYTEWTPLKEYPEFLSRFVLKAEDRRFYFHFGADPLAVIRAFFQNIYSGRIVSGGSTITQQLARIIYPMPENKYYRKLYELALAIRLELQFSKNEILEAYLNRVPLSHNRHGFTAAAKKLFQKSPGLLTSYEAAALTVLIRQSNATSGAFRKRFVRLFQSVYPNEEIDKVSYETLHRFVFEKPASENPNEEPFTGSKAPHFVEWLYSQAEKGTREIHTSVISQWNEEITSIVQNELRTLNLYAAANASVVVLEITSPSTARLLALVGSNNYSDPESGQVNGALAIRNAGSSLKPFIFARAMEKFNLAPYSLLNDSDLSFQTSVQGETYRPRNYDLNYWGRLSMREALSTSRNIPAILLLKMITEDDFFELLEKAGMGPFQLSPEEIGPGMALGTMGVSLINLSRAYTAFVNNGHVAALYLGEDDKGNRLVYGKEADLFSEKYAMYITSILSDQNARRKGFGKVSFLDFPFEVAAKTGTSKDYRDAWTIGYTSRYIVGVWVGNFSGDPMKKVSGMYGAGRIFQQVMRMLNPEENHRFRYASKWEKASFCRLSGLLANEGCPLQEEFIEKDASFEVCNKEHSLAPDYPDAYGMILSPVEGEVYLLDPHSPAELQTVPLEILPPEEKGYRYSVDSGKKISYDTEVRENLLLKPGHHKIIIFQNDRPVKTVFFEVQ